LAAARAEFAFLGEHGFREVPQPGPYINPYAVLYERGDWGLRIEGLSYGFNADVAVISPDGREAGFGHIVPASFRDAHREGLGRGQLGDVKFCALCLKTFGADFLSGDNAVFEELQRRVQLAAERDRDYWRQRDIAIAVDKAAAAFRSGRYTDVVSLLSPFEPSLPRAQVAKLDLARKRCQ
jgi:hypothetical protein